MHPITYRNDRVRLAASWRRDGTAWLLLAGRRRLGRVVPDVQYAMYRSVIRAAAPLVTPNDPVGTYPWREAAK